jgi:hypothetical protein
MRIDYRWLIGVLSVVISLAEFYYDFDNHADEVAFGGHYLLQYVKTAFNQTRRQLWMGKHILYHIGSREPMSDWKRGNDNALTTENTFLLPISSA